MFANCGLLGDGAIAAGGIRTHGAQLSRLADGLNDRILSTSFPP
jgi:hypothetical protein